MFQLLKPTFPGMLFHFVEISQKRGCLGTYKDYGKRRSFTQKCELFKNGEFFILAKIQRKVEGEKSVRALRSYVAQALILRLSPFTQDQTRS